MADENQTAISPTRLALSSDHEGNSSGAHLVQEVEVRGYDHAERLVFGSQAVQCLLERLEQAQQPLKESLLRRRRPAVGVRVLRPQQRRQRPQLTSPSVFRCLERSLPARGIENPAGLVDGLQNRGLPRQTISRNERYTVSIRLVLIKFGRVSLLGLVGYV